MKIEPDHEWLQYSGRIDFENRKAPVFAFAGSWVKIRFKGSGLSVEITNHRSYASNYLGYVLDGEQRKFLLAQDGKRHRYDLGKRLPEKEHELLLFKRMDACHFFTFHGFELEDGELLPPPEKPARRIEVFGDSVSCGEVSEALDYVGKEDPVHDGEFSNSWFSYSWMTARLLDAELHITAQGGAALLNGTGWFRGPDYIGMESIYDKMEYHPDICPVKSWDFGSWQPHVAVIAIGQNDANPEDYMAADLSGEKAENWKAHYQKWLERLMELYPGAHFVLTTTILNHSAAWDEAIDQVCSRIGSPRVHHFLYTRNGCGTPGHIRIPEAAGMAEELSAFLRSLGDIWQDN